MVGTPSSTRRLRRPRQGYNLVILMVLVTVMNVLIAVAMPTWSKVMRREREKELIFRGLQYAEAIRVFQVRQGRYPISLRELLEIEPRAIRQLWTDPLRDDALWGLVLEQSAGRQVGGQDAQGRAPGGLGRDDEEEGEEGEPPIPTEDVSLELDIGAPEGIQATGPILGVQSLTDEDSVITFMGSNSTSEWRFTAELIAVLPEGASLEIVPRLTSEYIGRPFPEGLEVQQGNAPGALGDAGGNSSRSNGRDDE